MNKKEANFLGLCKKAGQLSLGYDPVVETIKKKKTGLVLVSEDISENSLKKLEKYTIEYGVEVLKIDGTMDEIQKILGKRSGIISVNDTGFSKGIKSLFNEHLKGENNI